MIGKAVASNIHHTNHPGEAIWLKLIRRKAFIDDTQGGMVKINRRGVPQAADAVIFPDVATGYRLAMNSSNCSLKSRLKAKFKLLLRILHIENKTFYLVIVL